MATIFDLIEKLSAELKSLQPIKPEFQQKLDKKFRLEFNYNSNHIEGNTLTYSETELLLLFDDAKGSHTLREFEEMKAHDVTYQLIKEWAKDTRALTEADIKQLNEAILVRPFWKEAITADGQNTRRLIKVGQYKEHPNSVRLANGEIFEYASPSETPILMGELLDWYRGEENNIHPVTLAAMFHYKFVRIHPFDDGNGRISRLLMNYVLLRNDLPPVVIKSDDKRNYLSALHQADIGDYEPFIDYIGQQLVWSLEMAVKAAKGESIDEESDLDKELAVLKRELKTEDVLKHSADTNVIADVIEHNILPLFITIEDKMGELKEFFFDFNRTMTFEEESHSGEYGLGSKESNWETIKMNWLNNQVRLQNKKIKKLKYNYVLMGFKKTAQANNFHISLEINFNPYNYSIITEIERDSFSNLPYGKILSTEERMNIVSPIIKSILERIKTTKQ